MNKPNATKPTTKSNPVSLTEADRKEILRLKTGLKAGTCKATGVPCKPDPAG
jgi:hypothetical protein